MTDILKHPDGTPKCVTSDVSNTRTWHYITREGLTRHVTLCDRWISGIIVGDHYTSGSCAPGHEANNGQPLPICWFCANRREKLEKDKRMTDG